jgi:enoyl-CoA hydratase
MSYETIIAETKGRVGLIRLNRPNALNALNAQLIDELSQVLDAFEADAGIGCIVITGSDKAFAAGADIKQMQSRTYMQAYKEDFISKWDRVARARKPVVAAVAGFALGGGCELAMACDFVLASDHAKFGQPEINLGVFPPVAAYQLSRLTAPRKGLELLLTGDTLDADAAERLGLVNAVFPLAELDARAGEWLDRLYRQSASSLRFTKRAFRLAQSADFDERLANVERLYLEELMKTSDANEGLAAFMEKRKPAWTGR